MSRDLPPHPNLEHLRKQAKTLLADLRRGDQGARLADALHAVERQYVARWRGSHVLKTVAMRDGQVVGEGRTGYNVITIFPRCAPEAM
jgi:hypothetical protein